MKLVFWISSLFLCLAACDSGKQPHFSIHHINEHYWYRGLADIAVYRLQEMKYGGLRSGYAVSVWVTEDFDPAVGHKVDNPVQTDHVKVLKHINLKRFSTGIYDYSVMTSSFTGFHHGDAFKTVLSSQDWCGQSYIQQNLVRDGHEFRQFSYFEQLGDRHLRTDAVLMEDHIPGLLLLQPDALPEETALMMIPALEYLNATQQDIKAWPAYIAIHQKESLPALNGIDTPLIRVSVSYDELPRKVDLFYTTGSTPQLVMRNDYDLTGIEPVRISSATLHRFTSSDYWNLNTMADDLLRDSLFSGLWYDGD